MPINRDSESKDLSKAVYTQLSSSHSPQKTKKQIELEKMMRNHELLRTFSGQRIFYRENPTIRRPEDELNEFLGVHPHESKATRGGYSGLVKDVREWSKLPDFQPLLQASDPQATTSSLYNLTPSTDIQKEKSPEKAGQKKKVTFEPTEPKANNSSKAPISRRLKKLFQL
ncbi:hypothetical protein O181_058369 [Austropuccinia psidii MF-1]|uniref:Uncharacterized protein n=1 Tax=Austropuccinia psidii MF-1 TaxID=1389203 RepID=A0A9Q3EC69_9BASI|nr:hypothetical protein [Austropuccinia psidii MF-1]